MQKEMHRIYLNFDYFDSFHKPETYLLKPDGSFYSKEDILLQLITQHVKTNSPTTLPYKKQKQKYFLTINGAVCEISLSNTIDIYPQPDGTIKFEVRHHTKQIKDFDDDLPPEKVKIEYEKTDAVLAYLPRRNRKNNALIDELTVVKGIFLTGKIDNETIIIQPPTKPRITKHVKYNTIASTDPRHELAAKVAKKERDISQTLYPDISSATITRTFSEENISVKTTFSMPFLGFSYSRIMRQNKPMPFDLAITLINRLLAEIKRFESHKLVHCDLHLSNVLFNFQEDKTYIIDFENTFTEGEKAVTAKHAPKYTAPEIRATRKTKQAIEISFASHIYSVACIICDLLKLDKDKDLTSQPIPNITAKNVSAIKTLLQRALAKDPASRPNIDEFITIFDPLSVEYTKLVDLKARLKAAKQIVDKDLERIQQKIQPKTTNSNGDDATKQDAEHTSSNLEKKEIALRQLQTEIRDKIVETKVALTTKNPDRTTPEYRKQKFSDISNSILDTLNSPTIEKTLGKNLGIKKILNAILYVLFFPGLFSEDFRKFGFFKSRSESAQQLIAAKNAFAPPSAPRPT